MNVYWTPEGADRWVVEDERGDLWWIGKPAERFNGARDDLQPIRRTVDVQRPWLLTADLVGVAEIAQRAGVKADTIHKWRSRHSDFPRPIAELAAGPVWSYAAVERWLLLKPGPGRPRKDA